MADAFISYSRKDQEFVRKLDETLKKRERAAWVDWEGIMPSEEFMQAIYKAIDAADTFIFVLTPDSVISPICALEIEHAVARKKRLVPLVVRDVKAAEVPEALAKLNWIFCREADPFDVATDTLFSALDTDLEWVRAHTRLIMRAVEWENNGRNDSYLMRGVDLRAAEAWLTQAGAEKDRQPTALQTEYILSSRKAAVRRQRFTMGAVTFGAALAVVLAIAAWQQRGKAVAQEKLAQANAAEARAQEKVASANAEEARRQERKAKVETSLTAFLGASESLRAAESSEALRSLSQALQWNPANTEAATALINLLGQRRWPHQAAGRNLGFPIGLLRSSPDARRMVAAGDAPFEEGAVAKLSVLDVETLQGGDPLGFPLVEEYGELSWNRAGDRLLAQVHEHYDGESNALLLDANGSRLVKKWEQNPSMFGGWISQDGKWAIVCQENVPPGAAAPRRWLDVVATADGKPHPVLARISVQEQPLAADLFEGELRIVQSDGRVTVQSVANPKGAAGKPLFALERVADYNGFRFAPDGRSLVAAEARGALFWDLRPPGRKPAPEDTHEPTHVPASSVLDRNFAAYLVEATFDPPGEVTFAADYSNTWGETLRQVYRVRRAEGKDPEPVAEWTGRVSPIAVLPKGVAGVRGTMAFLAPLGGGAFSGAMRHAGEITAVCALGKDSVATASADGEVKVWRFSQPAFASALQSRPLPDRAGEELRARNRDFDSKPVEIRTERFAPPSADPNDQPITQDRLILVRAGKRDVLDLGPAEGSAKRLEGAALTPDGTRAVFYGPKELESERDTSGAWVLLTEERQITEVPTHCSWAGFTPDGQHLLTIFKGRLVFWAETPGAGGVTYQPTGQVLAQAGMTAAVFSGDGSRLATWAKDGKVIVWETSRWTPLHQFEPEPDWNMGLESDCAPALSHDGSRLAAAYTNAFVIWDAASGKRLSDPIDCGAFVMELSFTGSGSGQVEAKVSGNTDVDRNTLRRSVTWSYADVTHLRDGKGVSELGELAEMVAAGDWVAKAPALAARAQESPKVVADLLQHFAAQAKVLAAPPVGR